VASSAQLQQKAQKVRSRLSGHLDELRHVSPLAMVGDLVGAMRGNGGTDDSVRTLVQQARRNPVAWLLIAAGVSWLAISDAMPDSARPRRSKSRPARSRRARQTKKPRT
jgi:hypothetical protein